jgi:hypothetical protein
METLFLVIWLVFMLVVLWLTIRSHRQRKLSNRDFRSKTKSFSLYKKFSFFGKGVGYGRLWHEFLTLLGFDHEAAQRLLNFEKRKNPGKSEKWYLEKLIADIKRDRRY